MALFYLQWSWVKILSTAINVELKLAESIKSIWERLDWASSGSSQFISPSFSTLKRANRHRSRMPTSPSCSHHSRHTRRNTLLPLIWNWCVHLCGWMSITKLFIISIPWAAWTNERFQPNNSAIGGRYWMHLQHRIIHSRQQHGAK